MDNAGTMQKSIERKVPSPENGFQERRLENAAENTQSYIVHTWRYRKYTGEIRTGRKRMMVGNIRRIDRGDRGRNNKHLPRPGS